MRTQFKFQQGAQSIQDAQCNDADMVIYDDRKITTIPQKYGP